jgi:PAS domain S-box-containing protein
MAHDGASPPEDGRMLSAVLDDFPDPVFVKDAAHRWVYRNAAFTRLLGTDDLIGRDDTAFFPPEQVAVFWAGDDAVIAGGRVVVQEEAIGDGFWALVKKWPVTLPEGGRGPAGLIYDVTDYRNRALEAARAIRAAEAAGDLAPAPMLGLTAYADEDSRRRCLESGMDERLSKPLGAEELTAALARWTAAAD